MPLARSPSDPYSPKLIGRGTASRGQLLGNVGKFVAFPTTHEGSRNTDEYELAQSRDAYPVASNNSHRSSVNYLNLTVKKVLSDKGDGNVNQKYEPMQRFNDLW